MTAFSVWAPAASRVELDLPAGPIPMHPGPGGWWLADTVDAPAGTDYGFLLDDAGPFPDPRSPCQPNGVHGPSRVVDHSGFPWTDHGWRAPPLGGGVIYELHVGTFTAHGTFEAAIERLDHLAALGITHVELMPVAEFPGSRGWGYDGVDLYAPHHGYGGPEGLKRLVDACHARGLAVILDVVYNHLGPTGNHLGRFGPYFTDRHVTPWGDAINLDGAGSDEVRRFLRDNACMWLRDYHFDGLRIDAVHAITDMSAMHFLEELAMEVRALENRLGRPLTLIAESDLNDPRVVRSTEAGGHGLDALWNEDFHHALHAVLTRERAGYYADFGELADIAKALRQGFVYDGRYSRYRNRRHGRPAASVPGDRFVGFLQNHDQVGNRPDGARSSHLLSPGRLRIGAALALTAPFVPLLFQGEEWAASTPFHYFTDHHEPRLGQSVREGRQRELAAFGWRERDTPDPQARATFERCKLDWREPERQPHASLLQWYRDLIRLRRTKPSLLDSRPGTTRTRYDERAGWLVIQRGTIAVLCNLGHRQRIPLAGSGESRVLLVSGAEARPEPDGFVLAADSVAVIECLSGNGP